MEIKLVFFLPRFAIITKLPSPTFWILIIDTLDTSSVNNTPYLPVLEIILILEDLGYEKC